MTKLSLLIRATVRSQLRWGIHHIYSWLILGPLVLGLTYATAARFANNLPSWQMEGWLLALLALLFEAALIGLSLSRASAEIYHLRRPEASLEALPLPADTHLHAAMIARLARTTVAAAAILVAMSLFGGGELLNWPRLPVVVLWIMITASAELFGAINWIHWGHTKERSAALFAVIALLLSVVFASLLLALAIKPDELGRAGKIWFLAASLVWVACLYLFIRASHASWRVPDIEYARRLDRTSRRSVFHVVAFKRRLSPVVASQLARDLQLTIRAFSSAVYVVAGIAVLWIVVLLAVLTTDFLPPANCQLNWLDSASWLIAVRLPQVTAIKIASALATVSIAALLPVLVAYELPHLWLERAAGTIGLDMWQAKLWYTRLISLPVPLAAWLIGMAFGRVPLFYALPLLIECFLLSWAISSLIGALSFEMPNQPGLSIIVMVLMGAGIGIAGALAMMTSLFLILGFMLYAQVMHSLAARGRSRARYYLMTDGD